MNTQLFSGKAENYEAGRPSYPAQAIDYILSLTDKDAVFADIGAGTGKLTRLIAERGNKVFAVEPNRDMRQVCVKTLQCFQNVAIVEGTAEQTNIIKDSVDVVVCAQALHWFDLEKFRIECKRILKKNGKIVAVYNSFVGDGKSGACDKSTHRRQALEDFFKNATEKEFYSKLAFTKEKWLAFVSSRSCDPLKSEKNYYRHIRQNTKVFKRETIDGLLYKNLVTSVFSEKLK